MFFRGPLLPAEGKKRRLSGGQHFVGGQPVTVTGKRLSGKEDEVLIVISSKLSASEKPLQLYRRRWEIESLFAAMKSRGFNLETGRM
jgi:IS4 transposase